MNRTLTLVVLALTAGCAGRAPTGTGSTDAASDPLQQLEADTGQTWTVRWRDDLHTPALLEGRTAPIATTGPDAERAGRQFLRRYGALFGMSDADDVVAVDSDTDELGMTHARFEQQRACLGRRAARPLRRRRRAHPRQRPLRAGVDAAA